ncbi:MAG: LCP family protein, partial [Acidimicrobiales bacterium]
MPDSSGRLRAWRMRRREKKSLRSTLRRRLTRTGIAVLLLAVLLAGGGIGYVVYKVNEIQRVKVRNLVPVASAGRYKGIEDILLVGSTSRCALKVQNPAFGLCQNGVNGVNGDVVMVLRLDGATHRVTLLSFPRDTFIPNARPGQYNRIDSALAYGPGQLVSAIEEDFGVPINHYVVLNFDTFAAVVDALGGVNVYFPDRLYDNYSQLDITKTGCLHLNGFQALALVRAR